MFSSPNITTGFGTLGSSTPSQSALGLPNPSFAPSSAFNIGIGGNNPGNMGMGGSGGTTSSPAFSFNTPTSAPGQMPLNPGSISGTPGVPIGGMGTTPGMGMHSANTPQTMMGRGMLSVPGMRTGMSIRTSTPGGQSQTGTVKTSGGDRDGQTGISIEMALKGLEEAMAAVLKMEELLLSIKADQGRVFGVVGGRGEGDGGGRGRGDGAEQNQMGEDVLMGVDGPVGGAGVRGAGEGMGRVGLQRLQQTQIEYSQLQTALQQHLFSTTLGSLPLRPYIDSTSSTAANPSNTNAAMPGGTVSATASRQDKDTDKTPKRAMNMADLVEWAEKRAERDFERKEGVRGGARVVLDALKLR